jgi:uncharacterized protein with GYD domain
MALYVSLINLTDQGIRTIKDDVNRVRFASHVGEHEGVKIVSEWWTQGQYDAVMVFEAPNEETAARFLLAGARLGNFRSNTMRAFTQDEMQKVLDNL